MIPVLVLLVHFALTAYMTGVIWVVQLAHYPAFAFVDRERFGAFEAFHQSRLSWVVVVPMLAELATAGGLVWFASAFAPAWLVHVNAMLIGLTWLSTFALQVPLHNRLAQGWDAAAHRRLVATNWIRTVLWTLRVALLFVLVLRTVDAG